MIQRMRDGLQQGNSEPEQGDLESVSGQFYSGNERS